MSHHGGGEKGKQWTKVVADFNATTGGNISKLNDWRPVQRKYIQIRCTAENFHKSVLQGTATEEDISETLTKAYGIANGHNLEERKSKETEASAKKRSDMDAANQVNEGRALRLKTATRIVAGQVIQVGGPSMVLGDNGEVVNLDSDDDSAVGQVMATPAAKKLWRTNRDTVGAGGGSSSSKCVARDLVASLTQGRQMSADIEAKRLTFEQQQAEKKETLELLRIELEKSDLEKKRARQFELEKEDRQRKHDIMLQKMQMELQLAEVKIRLAQLELSNGNRA